MADCKGPHDWKVTFGDGTKNAPDVVSCRVCGKAHKNPGVGLLTAYLQEVDQLRAELAARDAEIERLNAENAKLVNAALRENSRLSFLFGSDPRGGQR